MCKHLRERCIKLLACVDIYCRTRQGRHPNTTSLRVCVCMSDNAYDDTARQNHLTGYVEFPPANTAGPLVGRLRPFPSRKSFPISMLRPSTRPKGGVPVDRTCVNKEKSERQTSYRLFALRLCTLGTQGVQPRGAAFGKKGFFHTGDARPSTGPCNLGALYEVT